MKNNNSYCSSIYPVYLYTSIYPCLHPTTLLYIYLPLYTFIYPCIHPSILVYIHLSLSTSIYLIHRHRVKRHMVKRQTVNRQRVKQQTVHNATKGQTTNNQIDKILNINILNHFMFVILANFLNCFLRNFIVTRNTNREMKLDEKFNLMVHDRTAHCIRKQ